MDLDHRSQNDTLIPNVFVQSPITQMFTVPFPSESHLYECKSSNLMNVDSFQFSDESQLYECAQLEKRQSNNSQSSECVLQKKRRIDNPECNTYTSNKRNLHTNQDDEQLPFCVKKQCSIQKFNNSIQLFPWKPPSTEINFNENRYKEWCILMKRFHGLAAEFSKEWTVNYDELELDEIDTWSDQWMSLNKAYNTAGNLLEIAWTNTDEAWVNASWDAWTNLDISEQELFSFLES